MGKLGEIDVVRAGEPEIRKFWREVKEANLFPGRKAYREFFRELRGALYFAGGRGPNAEYLLIGKWRSNGEVYMLWMLQCELAHIQDLIQSSFLDYLEAGDVVVTRMLDEEDTGFFQQMGFQPYKTILLLEGDVHSVALCPIPPPGGIIRSFRREDGEEVLRVDNLAFQGFWGIDAWNLKNISKFCSHNNFIVAQVGSSIVGYSIAGVNGNMGFIQRLAVHPGYQNQGWGKALLGRQLRWMRRWGACVFLVNTQNDNAVAKKLYVDMGFNKKQTPRFIYRYVHGESGGDAA
jgi:ribosomal-protein-alanine N-acetyltransferase